MIQNPQIIMTSNLKPKNYYYTQIDRIDPYPTSYA